MEPGAILAVVTTLSCVGLAVQFGLQRENPRMANGVVAVLASLAVWSTGSALHILFGGSEWRDAARRVVFLGSFATPSLWLLLALHHAAPRLVRGRTGVTVAVLTPAALFYVAALTNASHGWIVRPDATDAPGVASWAGPLAWVFIALATVCTLAGSALFVRTAWRLWRAGRRRSAVGLSLALGAQAAIIPLVVGGVMGYPLMPAGMAVAVIAVAGTALRHPLAESPPLGHREVLDHLSHGVVMANASGEILDHNPAAERIAGVGAEPLRDRLFADALVDFAAEAERPRLREALDGLAEARDPLVVEVETPDARAVEIRAFAFRDDADRVLGLIAVLRDRTEERRYAEVVRRTQKLETVGTLAAGIAHEVNNPLAFVRANLSEIERFAERVDARRQAGGSKLAEDLAELGELARDAFEGIDRIERAIADMRRLSSAPSQGLAYVDLNELVREAVRLAELRGAGGVRLETVLAESLPPVQGSPQLLVQALLNLLVNAQQAVEGRPGRVRVETRSEADAVWIDVADDGPGVAPEHRSRIFEPFYTTRCERGARGLGLSIAGDVARDHGGEIRLEEAAQGALFRVRIPAAGGPVVPRRAIRT